MSPLQHAVTYVLLGAFGSGRLLAAAIDVENYYLTAQTIGVSREAATALLDQARQELRESLWNFNAAAVARQWLMETYAARWPRPALELREAARLALATDWLPFSPLDVDRLARALGGVEDDLVRSWIAGERGKDGRACAGDVR